MIKAQDKSHNNGTVISKEFTVDNTKPSLEVEKPAIGKVYIFNREVLPTIGKKAVVIGKITVEVKASDALSGIQKVEFWVDGKYKSQDSSSPYEWTWDEQMFLTHTLKVVAYDNAGNWKEEEIEVFVFNPI